MKWGPAPTGESMRTALKTTAAVTLLLLPAIFMSFLTWQALIVLFELNG